MNLTVDYYTPIISIISTALFVLGVVVVHALWFTPQRRTSEIIWTDPDLHDPTVDFTDEELTMFLAGRFDAEAINKELKEEDAYWDRKLEEHDDEDTPLGEPEEEDSPEQSAYKIGFIYIFKDDGSEERLDIGMMLDEAGAAVETIDEALFVIAQHPTRGWCEFHLPTGTWEFRQSH